MKDYSKYIESTGTHYISNSGVDSKGTYHGDTAGDQNGKEWQLRAWYKRPWTVVLRYPDEKARTLFAQLSCAAALNDKVGYDQYQRYTYLTELSKAGWNPENLTTACEEDCTAGVTANWIAVGHLLGIDALASLDKTTRSTNMRARFVKAGFIALTESKYINGVDWLMPGDVLLYESHHAAANVTRGKKAEELLPAGPQVRIVNGNCWIRTEPGTTGLKLGVARKGEVYKYAGQTAENGWNAIEYNGITAWVSGRYSTVTGKE